MCVGGCACVFCVCKWREYVREREEVDDRTENKKMAKSVETDLKVKLK